MRYAPAMCNRYVSPEAGDIERFWHIGARNPWRGADVYPRQQGAFIRRAAAAEPERDLAVGSFGLVPWFSKTPQVKYATQNARFEELTEKASFKDPWKRGQRCVIPASVFFEPNWESGKNVWWAFRRADGEPWGIAGLWATWTDRSTGEIVESFTMLTLNADSHPLMRRMHKPDPKLPADQQDKRSVVTIEIEDTDQWLYGTDAEASALVKLPAADLFDAGPAEQA